MSDTHGNHAVFPIDEETWDKNVIASKINTAVFVSLVRKGIKKTVDFNIISKPTNIITLVFLFPVFSIKYEVGI
jgi:hypothetical protein